MPDLARVFADPPQPPSPFTYRAIEPSYDVHGWRVEIDRPALEWSELRDASRVGFALRGSGTGTVETPPLYSPSRVLDVDVVRGEGVKTERVRVGDDCRLRLEVPLGPGNPYQQYTVQARLAGTAVYTTRVRIGAEGTPGCPRGR
jgi:hypothetical protein